MPVARIRWNSSTDHFGFLRGGVIVEPGAGAIRIDMIHSSEYVGAPMPEVD